MEQKNRGGEGPRQVHERETAPTDVLENKLFSIPRSVERYHPELFISMSIPPQIFFADIFVNILGVGIVCVQIDSLQRFDGFRK